MRADSACGDRDDLVARREARHARAAGDDHARAIEPSALLAERLLRGDRRDHPGGEHVSRKFSPAAATSDLHFVGPGVGPAARHTPRWWSRTRPPRARRASSPRGPARAGSAPARPRSGREPHHPAHPAAAAAQRDLLFVGAERRTRGQAPRVAPLGAAVVEVDEAAGDPVCSRMMTRPRPHNGDCAIARRAFLAGGLCAGGHQPQRRPMACPAPPQRRRAGRAPARTLGPAARRVLAARLARSWRHRARSRTPTAVHDRVDVPQRRRAAAPDAPGSRARSASASRRRPEAQARRVRCRRERAVVSRARAAAAASSGPRCGRPAAQPVARHASARAATRMIVARSPSPSSYPPHAVP